MELPIQAATASMTLFHILDMNTALLNQDGSVLLLHERDRLPDFTMELQREDYVTIGTESLHNPGTCCVFTNAWGLSYISSLFRFDAETETVVVIGPFLKQVPDIYVLDKVFHGDQRQFVPLQEMIRGLKLISSSKIQSIANVLKQSASFHPAALHYLDTQPGHSGKSARDGGHPQLQQTDDNASGLIELRYKLEAELMHAIEKGDRPAIRKLGSHVKNLYDFSERFPNQPIRALRNMLIVLNTLLRTAARNGKVHPVYLHEISEKFSKQIERSDSIDALNALIESMHEEYCSLVERRSVTGYSPLVQQAMQYLMVHMSKPLDTQGLADHCHVHPSHLSRQFKKETGMTLTDYLNRQRIEEAKLLLAKERASVDWIAGYVGFEDAGYFARVFKKLEGMTPTQYRAEKG